MRSDQRTLQRWGVSSSTDGDQEFLGLVGGALLEHLGIVFFLGRVEKDELQLELIRVALRDALT